MIVGTRKHVHAEAFKLMTYKCQGCGQGELIWNSRDGVTPFIVACPHCGQRSQHVNWQDDIYAPDFAPRPGQRVFVDLPDELKLPIARRQVEAADGTPYKVKGKKRREKLAREIAKTFEPGSPHIIVWK